MKINFTLIAAVGIAAAPFGAHAADASTPANAANLANNCFACHGPQGRSPGAIPSINNLPSENIVTALKQFKSGERPSTVMARLTKGYSDTEIEAIGQYIASRKARITP